LWCHVCNMLGSAQRGEPLTDLYIAMMMELVPN
jgi:hypothetical protein